MAPANRIGYSELSVGPLKIMREVITWASSRRCGLHMQQLLKLDHLWAGSCLASLV